MPSCTAQESTAVSSDGTTRTSAPPVKSSPRGSRSGIPLEQWLKGSEAKQLRAAAMAAAAPACRKKSSRTAGPVYAVATQRSSTKDETPGTAVNMKMGSVAGEVTDVAGGAMMPSKGSAVVVTVDSRAAADAVGVKDATDSALDFEEGLRYVIDGKCTATYVEFAEDLQLHRFELQGPWVNEAAVEQWPVLGPETEDAPVTWAFDKDATGFVYLRRDAGDAVAVTAAS